MTQFSNGLILIIDTSEKKAFVALVEDGDVVGEKTWENSPDVGRYVLDVVGELLKEAEMELKDIDRIAVQAGPGRYYSSLRAGVTVANVLAYAVGADVVGLEKTSRGDLIHEASVAKPEKMVLPRYACRP